jgi:hypothetical protein
VSASRRPAPAASFAELSQAQVDGVLRAASATDHIWLLLTGLAGVRDLHAFTGLARIVDMSMSATQHYVSTLLAAGLVEREGARSSLANVGSAEDVRTAHASAAGWRRTADPHAARLTRAAPIEMRTRAHAAWLFRAPRRPSRTPACAALRCGDAL